MKNAILFFCFSFLLSSCEKGITFNLDNVPPKLVVEATIENSQFPVVTLSKSFNFFSTITRQELSNSFVHQADVRISNGTQTHQLKEDSVKVNNTTLYYYHVNPADPSTLFLGEEGKTYTLKIITDGQEYTSVTTIPLLTKKVDSIWWVPAPQNPDTNKVVVKAKITDPPKYGNYVRYFTQVGQAPFYAPDNSSFDDQVINGVTFTIDIDKGNDRNADIQEKDKGFFNRGDTVTLKFCNIDKATYDFWRTMEFNYSSTGNPFSSPNKVIGNISNGALGYFGGYAAQYRTLIIPK